MHHAPAPQAARAFARLARLFLRRTEAKASRAGPLIAMETGIGEPVWAPRDYATFAREGMMQNAIVYRSVRMISECAATVPLLLYSRDTEIEDHPLLDLIRRPSPGMTGTDLLETFFGNLLVSGNGYIEAAGLGGELRELHALRPDRVQVIPGPDGWPEAWDYTAGGTKVRISGEPAPGVRAVLHLKLYHPANDHYGLSPIEAAATAIDLHNASARWNKALLDNSARPSGALVYTSGQHMTAEQFERLKGELEASFQGARNAGRPLLLEGGLDWKAMSLSPRDLDFMEARHAAAREIALAIGVPPMLLGIPGDNTYANYAEANRAFWRQTVLPLVQRTTRALTLWLTPPYASDLRFEPDLDKIEALAPERDALWKRLEATSFLTDDEKRAAAGYDAKTEGGDSATGPFARKYREDQARDDQGRWVDEGGGGDEGGTGREGGDEEIGRVFTLVFESPQSDESEPSDTSPPDERESSGNTPSLIQIADRPLRGPGHHMMTNQTVREIGTFSKDALSVFDDIIANGGGRIPIEDHRGSKAHHDYNQRLRPFVHDWLSGNNSYGRAIEPSQMTKSEAQELLRAINRNPELSKFNFRAYMRGIIQFMRRPSIRNID